MPSRWRPALLQLLADEQLYRTGVVAALIFVWLDVAVLAAARRRFQRARLILD